MKVLVVNNLAPFVSGGAEALATHLSRQLTAAGHESEVLRLPFSWEPAARIPSQMLFVRTMELLNVDHVIALKFPAYLVRHHRKTLWVLHQYRQAYDLYDVGNSNIATDAEGDRLRAAIRTADNEAFAESRSLFVNSDVTRDRMRRYNGTDATVLLPPVNDPELFGGGASAGYVFAGGRVNSMKRQHLLVEAMRHAPPALRLVIAGPPDSTADEVRVRSLVEQWGLHDRVHLDLRFLPRQTYADYVNGAAAVAYLPYDEDSLGYVSMEAATAGKPLISTVDSGGILALAVHGETGWVAEADPQSLCQAMVAATAHSRVAAELGGAARERWTALGINWPNTLEALLR
ncbi:MAG: glycosyltransferase family 4 protein [Actinomycetota bacterium]|nr:glycosyltransferase family 4 protein [Actinomycetota bacterium]